MNILQCQKKSKAITSHQIKSFVKKLLFKSVNFTCKANSQKLKKINLIQLLYAIFIE